MNGQKRGHAFRRNWAAIAAVFGLFYLNGIVSAQPVNDRETRENRAALSYDPLLNFAKTEERDVIGQMKEELSGIVKERQKRLSDQRRAELETLMALSKMTGKFVNVVSADNQSETAKYGRNKRAVFDLNVKNLQKLFRLSGKLGLKGNAAYPVIRCVTEITRVPEDWYYRVTIRGGSIKEEKPERTQFICRVVNLINGINGPSGIEFRRRLPISRSTT